MKEELRVLIVEDSELDATLLANEIARRGYNIKSQRVETVKDFAVALESQEWDLILCDYYLVDFNALTALELFGKCDLDIPFIVVSASIGEETAVETMKAGADDYIMKDNLKRLVPAIGRELREAAGRRKRDSLESEKSMLAQAIKSVSECVSITDEEDNILFVNDAFLKTYQYEWDELIGKNISIVRPEKNATDSVKNILRSTRQGGWEGELENKRKDGTIFQIHLSTSPIKGKDGKIIALIGVAKDITERKRVEEALRESENRFRTLSDASFEGIALTEQGVITDCNDQICKMLRYERNELLGKSAQMMASPESRDSVTEAHRTKRQEPYEHIAMRRDGTTFPVEVCARYLQIGNREVRIAAIRDITESKQAALALVESEEKLRLIFENAFDGISIFEEAPDPSQRRLVNCNARYAEMAGRSREELLKMGNTLNLSRSLSEDNSESIEPGVHFRGTFSWIRPDGEDNIIEYSAVPIKMRGKTYTIGIDRDVTEREHVDDALRKSESRYRSLFENMLNGFAYCKMIFEEERPLDFVYLDVNRSFETLTGLKNVVGKKVSEVIPGIRESDAELFEVYGRVAATGKPEVLETYVKAMKMWFSISVYSPQREYFVAVFDVITERKRAEAERRQNRELQNSIFETSRDGILLEDDNETIVFVNTACARLLRYDGSDELMGKNVSTILGPEDAEQMKEYGRKRLQGESAPALYEFKGKCKDGSLLDCEISVSTTMIWGKKHIVSVIRDISERKKMEEERRHLEQEIRQTQKMESIGTLAGGIAHDFNNILGIILGHLSIVQGLDYDEAMRTASAQTISNAVQRGANLVRQILTFARKTDITLVPVNVNESIKEIRKMVAEMFPKSIEFAMDLEKGLPFVIIDADQFHQALLNLCVNARDAIADARKEGAVESKITLKTALVWGEELRKRFPEATTDQYIAVSVTDTGTGIDETLRKRIFEPFFTTKEKGKGTGLGLAVVYGVVQTVHGIMDVQSAPGHGSVFTLYLPVPKEASLFEPIREKPQIQVLGGTETLLIVEDEESLLSVLQMSLQNKGYRIVSAMDGREALERFKQHQDRIDLVITDLGLPKISGEIVLRELKKMKPSVKVIVASGFIDPNQRSELLKAGANDIISKPYEQTEVLQKVRLILDSQ